MFENNCNDSQNNQSLSTNEAFNCDFADHSTKYSFRVLSQTVKISKINFLKRFFHVSTEIQIIPIYPGLTEIVLDLGDDCILPNEFGFIGNGTISVNDIEAKYIRNKFQIPSELYVNDHSIFSAKNAFIEAQANYAGDLIILIPPECMQYMIDQIVVKIHIDLLVYKPKQGIIFVTSENLDDKKMHLYTYRSGPYSSTKNWLPCVESSNQLAIWRFEFTLPKDLTVVSCGDLIDTVTNTEDETQNILHYQLLIPTSPINIGFAIGYFQIYYQPNMPEIVSFCLPGLLPLLKHTVITLNRIFMFFEEILSCRFPFGFYRQVFVNQLPDEINSFAGLTIFSLHMLYHKKILDLVQISRQHLAHAIAQQFFGCFVNPADFREFWLTKSLARYITGLYVERTFGQSEHIYQVNKTLKLVCEYEKKFGKIIIARNNSNLHTNNSAIKSEKATPIKETTYFDPYNPDFCSSIYIDALYKKGYYILIMLQKRLGKDLFLKVLHRILSVAVQYSQNLSKTIDWFHMIVSTESFFRTITNITGRELSSFIEQWIQSGGHVHFEINHTFNRKQNKLELEIKQPLSNAGVQSYVGPLTILIQELDRFFSHVVQVDATVSKHDIVCHSKGRKQKKKKIPLSCGEEVEIDVSQMDADSPVMWIRVDSEMLLLRQIYLNQQTHQWEYMLRYERDVLMQFQAIEMLQQYPVHQTQNVLMESVENEFFFYKVRCAAARCLVDVCNRLPEGLLGNQHPLIAYFQRMFCCKAYPNIPQPNNYVATPQNLQHYFLMMDLPLAIAKIRTRNGLRCPREVLDFLLNLVKLNDNTNNRYSDDYYRASLINALGNTLVLNEHNTKYPNQMNEDARLILSEVLHALNMDTMKPSYGKIVTIQCLYTIQTLQRLRHIPIDLDVFWHFAECKGVYSQVRRTALSCIILLIQRTRNSTFSQAIIRLIEEFILGDSDCYIRHKVAEYLCQHPPFFGMNDPLQTALFSSNFPQLAQVLWKTITNPLIECQIRLHFIDLYYQLYGKEYSIALKNNYLVGSM